MPKVTKPFKNGKKLKSTMSRPRKRKANQQLSKNVQGHLSYTTVARPLMGSSFKSTLIYAEAQGLILNPGAAGLAATYVFSANGMYDPNITGVGHQPSGFDQLMAFYDHFTVIGSKITVRFNNGDAVNQQHVGIFISDSATALVDPSRIMENGKGSYSTLGNADGACDNCITLEYQASMERFLGRKNIMSEDNCRGSASANPTEQAYWHVWGAPGTAVDGGTIGLRVVIEYIAVFTEPKNLPSS